MEKLMKYLATKGLSNYKIQGNVITFDFLVGENRKRVLSYLKRLHGEYQFYNYDSAARIEKHIYSGCAIVIQNY